jgi:hypothetical protein
VPANLYEHVYRDGRVKRFCRTCQRERNRRRREDPIYRAKAEKGSEACVARMKATRPVAWEARKERMRNSVASLRYYRGKDPLCRDVAFVIVRLRRWLTQQERGTRPLETKES